MTVAQYGSVIGTQKADEEAYLYLLARSNGGNPSDANAVAWNILEGAPALTPSAQALYSSVTSTTFAPGYGAGVTVYYPIVANNLDIPQTFLRATPEPSTLVLFGTSIIGLAAVLRKRKV